MPTNQEINNSLMSRIGGKKLPAWMLAASMLIGGSEGLRQYVYTDPVGIPTVCFGQTGKDVKLGQPMRSLDQCSDLMVEQLVSIDKRLSQIVKVPLSDGEKIAYSSMLYNLGEGRKDVKDGFVTLKSGRQTTLLTLLNKGDHLGACQQIMAWINPKWLPGLKIRRTEETKMCLRDLGDKSANDPFFAWVKNRA